VGLEITWFSLFLAFIFFPIIVPILAIFSIFKIVKWEQEQKRIHEKRYEYFEKKAREKNHR
jgi:hypothetical protein